MAQLIPQVAPEKKRVKVYVLQNNDWYDKGTGFCTASYIQTEDSPEPQPQVYVKSEETPDTCLLSTIITKDDGFQKQQDTLIVWTDPPTGIDMALSFQEAEGCSMIWKFINSVKMTFPQDDKNIDGDLAMELVPSSVSLPTANLSELQDIDQTIRFLSSQQTSREGLCKFIMTEDYIPKLIVLFHEAEDLESLSDLHLLCNILKQIILLNDSFIIEQIVHDDCIMGVIGALEYDPDFSNQKANHRQWLNNQKRFREVVKIAESRIECKIHQTYRLQYLKDVVLARVLDDATFSILNSLIFYNQVAIVQHIQSEPEILSDLFSVFNPSSSLATRRRDAVIFIQQCCTIAKNIELTARASLYNNFIANGLLRVINYGLKHQDVSIRVGATDIMVSMIDHDPQLVRNTMYRQVADGQPPLTDNLIDILLTETDLSVKSQISDAIKVLLDTVTTSPSPACTQQMMRMNPEMANQLRQRQASEPLPQQEEFIKRFYLSSAERLFKPLMDVEKRKNMMFSLNEAALFGYLIDILIFFLRQHHLSKSFVFKHDFTIRLTRLFEAREKHLKLIPVRLVRHMLGMRQEFCLSHLISRDSFVPIFNLLRKTLPRDNLVSSACFDVFDYINREKIHNVAKYLVETHRDIMESDDLKKYHAFKTMCANYDASKGFTYPLPLTELDKIMASLFRPRQSPELVAATSEATEPMPTTDSEYWNASESEGDGDMVGSVRSRSTSIMSGKPLVDYHSDSDSDENPDSENVEPGESIIELGAGSDDADDLISGEIDDGHQGGNEDLKNDVNHVADESTRENTPLAQESPEDKTTPEVSTPPRVLASEPTTPTSESPGTPPEQIALAPAERSSEKRRREEEDDSEFSTTISKRRLSSSSATSSVSVSSGVNILRRKTSFVTSPSTGASKIGMNVTQSPVTTGSGGSDTE
ncbi:suppressor of Mek1 [Ceratocystis lukuohia]|uniref:Suppressor of Mek1 n=1 Tax=Ceratocystis lukuohia TaxID=2019550 RepID=A0ABR4MAT6_9PEZI